MDLGCLQEAGCRCSVLWTVVSGHRVGSVPAWALWQQGCVVRGSHCKFSCACYKWCATMSHDLQSLLGTCCHHTGLCPRTWPLFLGLVVWKMTPKIYILVLGAHKYCLFMKRSFVQHQVWSLRTTVAWVAHVALSVVTNVCVRGHLR